MPLVSQNPCQYSGISLSAYLECVLHLLLHLALATGRAVWISREYLLLRLPRALPCNCCRKTMLVRFSSGTGHTAHELVFPASTL